MSDEKQHWRDPRPEDYTWHPKPRSKPSKEGQVTEPNLDPETPTTLVASDAQTDRPNALEVASAKLREVENKLHKIESVHAVERMEWKQTLVDQFKLQRSAKLRLLLLQIVFLAAIFTTVAVYYFTKQTVGGAAFHSSESLRKQLVELTAEVAKEREANNGLRILTDKHQAKAAADNKALDIAIREKITLEKNLSAAMLKLENVRKAAAKTAGVYENDDEKAGKLDEIRGMLNEK